MTKSIAAEEKPNRAAADISTPQEKAVHYWIKAYQNIESLLTNGRVAIQRGNPLEGKLLFERALQICTQIRKITPLGDRMTLPLQVGAQNGLGVAHQSLGQYEEAETYLRAALETLYESSKGNRNVISLSVSKVTHQLASVVQRRGNYAVAEALYKKSLKMNWALGNESEISRSHHGLAFLYYNLRELEQARRHIKKALEMRVKIHEGEDHIDISVSNSLFGSVLMDLECYDEAEKCLLESARIERALYGGSSAKTINLARSLQALARNCQMQGKYASAGKFAREALDVQKKIFGDHANPDVANTFNLIGLIALDEKDYKNAAANLRKCVDLRRKLGGAKMPGPALGFELVTALEYLGDAHRMTGAFEDAKVAYEDAKNTAKGIGRVSAKAIAALGELSSGGGGKGRVVVLCGRGKEEEGREEEEEKKTERGEGDEEGRLPGLL